MTLTHRLYSTMEIFYVTVRAAGNQNKLGERTLDYSWLFLCPKDTVEPPSISAFIYARI